MSRSELDLCEIAEGRHRCEVFYLTLGTGAELFY
jgi:hypothetical protein